MRYFYFLLLILTSAVFAQDNKDTNVLELSFSTGNVLPHTPDLYNLQGHPNAVMLSYIKQTHGTKEWHSTYNFPDYGGFFMYQNFDNEFLGKSYSAGVLYNFYFLNRNLRLHLSQGLAYVTQPYDKVDNNKNKAFGSSILNNSNIGLTFNKENIFDKFGVHAGILFTHYSNGRTKAPNSGINTYTLNIGVNYDFDGKSKNKDSIIDKKLFREPLHYNFILRTGINESAIINSGQYPFYHIGFFLDKRIGRKSGLQFGTELFLTQSLKNFIDFRSAAYPEANIDPNTDYKRVGVFVGHELYVNRFSIEAQVGYYVYDPLKNDIPIYDRIGLKYYITKKIYTGFTIKTHLFLAEALEFALGVRL